jgi:hypothetical protein
MPKCTLVAIPEEEQAQMLAVLRRARYGYLLALHILLLCAAKRTPTDIAAVLFCSRSSVYRTVQAYRTGALGWEHNEQGQLLPPVRTTVLLPTFRRSLVALLRAHPPGLWLVPYALELCHPGSHAASQTGPHGVSRDDAALAP